MKDRIITIVLFLSLFPLGVLAQKAVSIKSFTLTTDHIPSGDRRNDLNGNPCALVKVQVVDDIERIEGNKIGDIVNHGVEKWIYMCKDSRNMRIHFKNHLPIRVTFRDYKINGLESNRVYELILSTPDQPKPHVDVKGNNLQMRVTPTNATITIWGDNYQRKSFRPEYDGTLRVHLPYGRYHYIAKADGYNDLEGSVFVNDENKWEDIRMGEIMGNLTINCFTKGVDYYINGQKLTKDKKTLFWSGQLSPGQYNVEAKKKGYVTTSQTVVINANQTTLINLDDLVSQANQSKIDKKKKKQEKKQLKEKAKSEQTAIEAEKKVQEERERLLAKSQIKKSISEKKNQKNRTNDDNLFVFGVRAGANLASLGLKSEANGSCSMITSFHTGINADILLIKQLHLNTSLLFSEKGYKYEHDYDHDRQETAKAQFIMLPIQLSYRIGMLQINAGPYLEYGLGGKIEYGNRNNTYKTFNYYDALNYGIVAGAGVNMGKNFYLGANYELGLSNYANRNIAISLGYNF